MSRFEASGSPVDVLVSKFSGLPSGPTSNGLIFIVSAGTERQRSDASHTHTGARTYAAGMCGAAEMLTIHRFMY